MRKNKPTAVSGVINNMPQSQSGSAMVEFVLVASVLVPMLLLMPRLAKTADVSLMTTQAARYGAWEQTVNKKSGEELVTEVSNRFYTSQDTAIQSGQGALVADANQNMFWGGAGLKSRAVTTGKGTVAVGVKERGLGGIAGNTEKIIQALGDTAGALSKDTDWDLGGGIYSINIGVTTKNTKQALSKQASTEQESEGCGGGSFSTEEELVNGCILHRSAILVDSWSSEGPSQVARRTRSLVPAAALARVGDALAIIGKTLPIFQELENLEGALGYVAPDILPPDRTGSE